MAPLVIGPVEPFCVYVAGPLYGSGEPETNIRRVLVAAEQIIERGMAPFVPHLFHYWHTGFQEHPAEYWLTLDHAWLLKCDVLLRLDGESPGADKEETWARQAAIDIVHGLDSLWDWHANHLHNLDQIPERHLGSL